MPDSSIYPVVVYWSEDDRAFIAEIPDLPGCMADGSSQTEALHNVGVIAQEWIVTALELGRTIPTPRQRLQFAA
ncbi:type II toxin-antitoxin system HicB family antitoxin [Hymenobacter terricola]|uniref:type II toxin-antitoxin system HicB family antitoxin n=1 Tax=Hymenobacter terricola TaxID=2819236 RepID=UPI001B30D1AC|nr:type II toxin-antitoxin system HicB family antitoxin [Hymenobacter terricola]